MFDVSDSVNIIADPAERAWNICRLENIACVMRSFPFLDKVTILIDACISRIDKNICQEVNQIMEEDHISTTNTIDDSRNIIDYLNKLNKFTTKIDTLAAIVMNTGPATVSRYQFHKELPVFRSFVKEKMSIISTVIAFIKKEIEKLSDFDSWTSDKELKQNLKSIKVTQNLLSNAHDVVYLHFGTFQQWCGLHMGELLTAIKKQQKKLDSIYTLTQKFYHFLNNIFVRASKFLFYPFYLIIIRWKKNVLKKYTTWSTD
jgi:hypothetical protein